MNENTRSADDSDESEEISCFHCGGTATSQDRFCSSCGQALQDVGEPEPIPESETGTAPPRAPTWREVAQSAREAAAPYIERTLASAQRAADSANSQNAGQAGGEPQADDPEPEVEGSAQRAAKDVSASSELPEKRTMTERFSRKIGDGIGYTTRSAVGVATEPVVDKVWRERPNLPLWQRILGIVGWVLLVFNPVGWAILGGSFVAMVLVGPHSPYSWAAWITQISAYLFIAAVVLGALVGLVELASQ